MLNTFFCRAQILVTVSALGWIAAGCSGSSSDNGGGSTADCSGAADGVACSDGNPCTKNDTCQYGGCAGTPVSCGANTSCTGSVCDASSGACVSQALAGPCSTTLTALPLTGCAVSDYTLPVTVGTQTFALTFDSGSSTLALASTSCQACQYSASSSSNCVNPTSCGVTPEYTPGASATDTHKTATADYGGGEGWIGEAYTDSVTPGGGVPAVTMALASITSETMQEPNALPFFSPSYCSGNPVGNDDQGIFGVGGTGAGAANTDAYIVKLADAHTTAPIFSVQMCDTDGFVWFGGYDPTSMTGSPQFTPLLDANNYYIIGMSDIRFGGITLALKDSDFGTVIVDTGTSILLLPDNAYAAVTNAIVADTKFASYFGTDFFAQSNCLGAPDGMTAVQLDAVLPTFSLVLPAMTGGGTIVVELPATESYLTPVLGPDGSKAYCAAVASSGPSGTGGMTVIGNSLLHSQITIFDRQNMQVGFAPQVNCTFYAD